MRKTGLMKHMEARFGWPLQVILPEMPESRPAQLEEATALGVHKGVLHCWRSRVGLRKERHILSLAIRQ